ncbi:MAG: cytochrome c biogenesis protein CcsA [Thermoanaerobaculaceae bacterium]|nr:cytochrome c biogenesis protein CcsA [Thermoanaerobaculaceae bacterium]MDI9621850.1 cytochrome c biogenesis protein [Acidobacteriota bacterium]HPW54435.1 cytochrome c biogenesis protein [Thermoanaerobaculaceae bacterium]
MTKDALKAVLPWVLGLWLAGVTVAGLLWAPAAAGFHGDSFRIVFFHVPQAWVAVLAFCVNLVASIRYLRTRAPLDDARAAAAARLGMLFAILATVTGSIFAKLEWGMFWNWDPRETSIVILLLIYAAYFALRQAVVDEERRASLAAAFAIFAFVTMPFLIFVIPRVYSSLHPNLVEATQGAVRFKMDPGMRLVLFSALAGFTGLFAWLYSFEVRLARVLAARHSREEA